MLGGGGGAAAIDASVASMANKEGYGEGRPRLTGAGRRLRRDVADLSGEIVGKDGLASDFFAKGSVLGNR